MQTEYTNDPYGGTTMQGTANANSYEFTGRENDGDGLYSYRARYYNPRVGRFVSQDPMALASRGSALYVYALDAPSVYRDPLGQDPYLGGFIGIAVGGYYGALGAAQCGGWKQIIMGAAAGALGGGALGLIDPTFGLESLSAAGAIGGALGDAIGQWGAHGWKGPIRSINWGSVYGSALGGALGGGLGPIAGEGLGTAFEVPEALSSAVGASAGAPLQLGTAQLGARVWNHMTGRGCGCQ